MFVFLLSLIIILASKATSLILSTSGTYHKFGFVFPEVTAS